MASTFWVNSGVDWMMPASHILRYGIDPWVLSCISMFLLTLRSLSGSYGAEATLLKVIQKKHVHMIETKKAKETSRSFVALARTQYVTNFIKSGENSLILTPQKTHPRTSFANPTVPSPKNPPEKSLKLMKIWYWSFWPGILVDLLSPAKIIASFQWRALEG